MRRPPQTQWRFLGNNNHLEVHDLDNEQTGTSECQIDEIIEANNAFYVKINDDKNALTAWLQSNSDYDGCRYCLPEFHNK